MRYVAGRGWHLDSAQRRLHAGMSIVLVACLALAVLCLSGCRVSDALTEVIYDQTSEVIDYNNPTKIYINDSTAELESDQFAAKEVSEDADVVSDTVQNLVVYSSSPNTQGFTAKKSVWSVTPDFRGIEASETVAFVKSDDPNAFDHPLTIEEPQDDPEEPEEEQEPEQANETTLTTSTAQGATSTSPETNKSPKGDVADDVSDGTGDGGWADTPEESSDGEGRSDAGDAVPEEGEQDGGNDNGDVQVAYDAADPNAEPPQVDSIAAFGPAATIVQMIGGTGALAATDAETLSGGFASVFDTAKIVVGWSNDGTDAADMNVDAIVESGAKVILVYESSYIDGLSESDRAKLSEAGVSQVVIYPLTNSGNIKHDVNVVGDMLSDSLGIQYAGSTQKRAQRYEAFHDEVVEAAAQANGGLAGEKVLQGGDDTTPATTTVDIVYTVLIDEYDPAAHYTGNEIDGWTPADGLAFASAGYNATPVSYYLQAGGLVNNAAQQTNKGDAGEVVVWQFMNNSFSFDQSRWAGGSMTESAKEPSGYSLLTTMDNLHAMFPFGSSFGSASLPRLIVTDASIEDDIIANSKLENGCYHPYAFIPASSTSAYSTFGPVSSIPSCIGFDGTLATDVNLFDVDGSLQIRDEDIVVNPRGLFSDWTQGTVESFLEAAWASDIANGMGDHLGWDTYVANFYSEFYGYSLTETDWIKMNPEGKY